MKKTWLLAIAVILSAGCGAPDEEHTASSTVADPIASTMLQAAVRNFPTGAQRTDQALIQWEDQWKAAFESYTADPIQMEKLKQQLITQLQDELGSDTFDTQNVELFCGGFCLDSSWCTGWPICRFILCSVI